LLISYGEFDSDLQGPLFWDLACTWSLLLCTQHCRHVHSHWSGVFNLLKFDRIVKKKKETCKPDMKQKRRQQNGNQNANSKRRLGESL